MHIGGEGGGGGLHQCTRMYGVCISCRHVHACVYSVSHVCSVCSCVSCIQVFMVLSMCCALYQIRRRCAKKQHRLISRPWTLRTALQMWTTFCK